MIIMKDRSETRKMTGLNDLWQIALTDPGSNVRETSYSRSGHSVVANSWIIIEGWMAAWGDYENRFELLGKKEIEARSIYIESFGWKPSRKWNPGWGSFRLLKEAISLRCTLSEIRWTETNMQGRTFGFQRGHSRCWGSSTNWRERGVWPGPLYCPTDRARKGLDVRSNIRVRWSASNLKAVDAVLVNCPERFSWQSEV